jgi:dethiobiotin synthetase
MPERSKANSIFYFFQVSEFHSPPTMMLTNTLLIAGTDTDAGKSVLTTALAAYWQEYLAPQSLALFKPLQSGLGDRELYQRLFHLPQTAAEITPLYFQAPLAPPLAAELEQRSIDLGLAWQTLQTLRQRHDFVLVEAAGGLGSPMTRELTVADLGRDWKLPAVLVVPIRLGAIGQAVANCALARQNQLPLRGIVLNCTQPRTDTEIHQWAAPELISSLTQLPILGTLPYLENPEDLTQLRQAAAGLTLEAILPLRK